MDQCARFVEWPIKLPLKPVFSPTVTLRVARCRESTFVSSNKCIASSNRCLTSSNKKLVVTGASLVVTGALLVVTRS